MAKRKNKRKSKNLGFLAGIAALIGGGWYLFNKQKDETAANLAAAEQRLLDAQNASAEEFEAAQKEYNDALIALENKKVEEILNKDSDLFVIGGPGTGNTPLINSTRIVYSIQGVDMSYPLDQIRGLNSVQVLGSLPHSFRKLGAGRYELVYENGTINESYEFPLT